MNMDALVRNVPVFQEKLNEIKARAGADDFTWYGYDILGSFWHLDALLKGEHRDLRNLIGNKPVADIGAGDGDLSFFFETMGVECDIIDYHGANWNGLRGARELKKALKSKLDIYDINLNTYFSFPRNEYGLVFFLGILYHLQNPYYVLQELSRCSQYLILSTRIAKFTAQDGLLIDGVPLAYLLDEQECNNDSTNYWIFTEKCLQRLLMRTGWATLDFLRVGDTAMSNPYAADHDERAFALAGSKRAQRGPAEC